MSIKSDLTRLVSQAFREAAKTPSLVSARVDSSDSALISINTKWSVSNLATNAKTSFNKNVLVGTNNLEMMHESIGAPETGVEMTTVKEDTVVRVVKGPAKDDVQTIEIWDRVMGLVSSFNLKDVDVHGRIYTDSEFGSLQLSEDKKSLYYIAEKKKEKNVPFLSQAPLNTEAQIGGEYKYVEEWGEQLVGKANPVIIRLELGSEQPVRCEVVKGVEPDYSPGLVRPWEGGLVGVAYRTSPRRLGKVYCTNRPSLLFHIPAGAETWTVITGLASDLGITRLRTSPSGTLVWLERSLSGDLYPGPHGASLRLMSLDSVSGEIRQVVSEQQSEFTTEARSPFAGLFNPSISPRPWLDNVTLALSGPQGETTRPMFINIETKEVTVPGDESCLGVEILDVTSDIILGRRSDPLTPGHLVTARLTGLNSLAELTFKEIKSPAPCPVPGLTWRSFSFNPGNIFTAHYIGPKAGSSVPLIVWPHGGPHSVITTDFKTIVMFFCQLGYGVLYVNYRGSLGFGEDNVRSLLGRVGDQDVQDCHEATLAALDNLPQLDREKVVLMGGSHGGFLVTHLAGQFPDLYKAVVARNPVTNIASMAGVTDISDWTWNEAGISYNWLHPTPETLTSMWNKSPISHIESVKAPIFLMIGKNDLRVPPSQGYEFFHSLKALVKTVEMNVYDDNHPLGKVENDVNVMINAALFYHKHLNM